MTTARGFHVRVIDCRHLQLETIQFRWLLTVWTLCVEIYGSLGHYTNGVSRAEKGRCQISLDNNNKRQRRQVLFCTQLLNFSTIRRRGTPFPLARSSNRLRCSQRLSAWPDSISNVISFFFLCPIFYKKIRPCMFLLIQLRRFKCTVSLSLSCDDTSFAAAWMTSGCDFLRDRWPKTGKTSVHVFVVFFSLVIVGK